MKSKKPLKIRLLSDLHLELQALDWDFTPVGEDIMILAGDIHNHIKGIEFAKEVAKDFKIPVIVLAGNHEFWCTIPWETTLEDLAKTADLTNQIKKGKVTFFENSSAVYKGVRFIGATLWTDMEYFGLDYLLRWKMTVQFPDYKIIPVADGNWITVEQTIALHQESLAFIKAKLEEPFDGPTVVITHHTPSSLSVAEHYKTDWMTAAFSSRLEDFILDHDIALWGHGHTHDAYDYQLGSTRVVCNPRGYYPLDATGFNPNLIIEV